jgi:hypothetical protein
VFRVLSRGREDAVRLCSLKRTGPVIGRGREGAARVIVQGGHGGGGSSAVGGQT